MKRRPIVLFAVLSLIVVTAAGAAATVIPIKLAKTEIAERISAWAGQPFLLRGKPEVMSFPRVGFEMRDFSIMAAGERASPPLVRGAAIEASLRILPLLSGRAEIGTLTLVEPRIHLVGDGLSPDGWRDGTTRQLTAMAARLSRSAGMQRGEIILRDGTISHEDRATGRVREVTEANLRISWDQTSEPASVSGTFRSRDRTVTVDAGFDDPRAIFSSEGSQFHLTLSSEPAEDDDQVGNDPTQPKTAAATGLETISQDLAGRLGLPVVSDPLAGPLHLAGNLQVGESSIALSDAEIESNDSTAIGTLALNLESGKPHLQGSLSFSELQLAPYIDAALPRSILELIATPVSAELFDQFDMDLDLVADELSYHDFDVADAAAKVDVRDGRLAVTLDGASLDEGQIAGEFSMAQGSHGVVAGLSGALDDVSLPGILDNFSPMSAARLIHPYEPPQGDFTALFDLTANGPTLGALVASLSGHTVATVRDGSLKGADIVSTLERLTEGNTVIAKGEAPFLPVGGWTAFDVLAARVSFANGILKAERVRIEGDQYKIAFHGRGDLTSGELEAEGVASLFEPEQSNGEDRKRPAVELPFGIGGSLHEVAVTPGIPQIRHHAEPSIGLLAQIWQQISGTRHDE